MANRIDSIYCFDYTKEIGRYDSLRDFSSEKMTFIGLALSTPKVHVNATPYTFDISVDGSSHIRERIVPLLTDLQEISEDLAVNSPKYILICYFDGSKQYFAYNEQFFVMFKIAFRYKPQEESSNTDLGPYALQKSASPAIKSTYQPQQPDTSAAQTPKNPTSSTYAHDNQPSTATSNDSLPWGKIIAALGIFLFIFIAIVIGAAGDSTINEGLTPYAEPASGTILSGKKVSNGSKITVHASSSNSCVVKLKTRTGIERISFYVRAGETVTINVPAEHLYVYFATGKTWYGTDHLFGEQTYYKQDKELINFERGTSCTYKLNPVTNGNLSLKTIGKDDF